MAGERKTEADSGWDGKTTRISYTRYPNLSDTLLNLLKSGLEGNSLESPQKAAETVFPALDIIRRAGPPESHRDELYQCVVGCLSSHMWHVRELAARTACSFLIQYDWIRSVQDLVETPWRSNNGLHGMLLTVKYTLERLAEVATDYLNSKNSVPSPLYLFIGQLTLSISTKSASHQGSDAVI